MHPILIAGFVLNLFLILSVFKFLGLVLTFGVAIGIYYFLSKNAGPSKQHWAQIAAIGMAYLIGIFAISSAPWSEPLILAGGIIMEMLVFAIFSFLRH